jgi:site-specific DNA recombinase
MRVSSEEQRERQTIEIQREFARKYCELHEIPIADFYADDGVTGTIALGDRPEGRRLLDDVKEKRFDTVLLYRLDRLGRDPRLILNAVNELESLGVEIKSMSEPFDTSNPSGRFMLTILSGVAGLERETIVQRMSAGTDRAVREGMWSGVVPYGYRREGERRHARLVIAEEPIPGLALSEADAVRLVFRMSAAEGKSCMAIATHLNRLGVPPAYQIPGHATGRRKRNTAGIWRPGRVRHLLVNTVYKGIHTYGRHSAKKRELIERQVPAIVDAETWDRAQQTLRKNTIWSPRNGKRNYLLRGLMKCSLCGMTLCGSKHYGNRPYYVCSGKHGAKGAFGKAGAKCPSRPVPGDLEQVVWADIEGFLRDPGPVLAEVAASLADRTGEAEAIRKEVQTAERSLAKKEQERLNILTLYRRGRIDDASVDQQLTEVEAERDGLIAARNQARVAFQAIEEAASHLESAEALLASLNARLDAPLTFALKRELVETLVEAITVDTIPENGKRELVVTVHYRFTPPAAPDSRSSFATGINRGCSPRPR